MLPQVEIQMIAVITAVACALSGTFLVLRRLAMVADAISHAILPGIVIAFFVTGNLNSPLLMIGAAMSGVATVALVELLQRTRLVKEDAAVGLVFPMLFAVGIVLITRMAGNLHLDTDSVLLGELAFAPYDRLVIGGHDLGPRALWLAGGALLLNVTVILLLFKELKLIAFDPSLAASLGFAPVVLHYGMMSLVSVTAVASFDAVGLVLVVALMVGPAAAAWLLTDRLSLMLPVAAGLGAASAVGGYWLARAFDTSIAGAMAVTVGVIYMLALTFAPRLGIVARRRHRTARRLEFDLIVLTVHLAQHEGTPAEAEECRHDRIHLHLQWQSSRLARVVAAGKRRQWLEQRDGLLHLRSAGQTAANDVFGRRWPLASR